MTIQASDIKLFESQRLTDTDDGGGRRTGNEVTDGAVNNLFPDISRLDRTFGRVNLRKAFTAVDTDTTDKYFGSHVIVDDGPDDPNVGVLLFSTGSHTDERIDAQDRIESYVVQGPEAPMRLLGDQLEGQRSVIVYQREDEKKPEIADVYVLSIEDSNLADDGAQQFVRVADVTSEIRTFTEETGSGFVDFDARVVTISITTELGRDFPGAPAQRDFATPSTVFRSTNVANAATYYGIATTEEAIANGDTQIKLDSVFRPVVPSTRKENPQVDVDAGATVVHEEDSGSETVEVRDTSHTEHDKITIQNRGLSWAKTFKPIPAPGTLVVEFRALGNWQRIEDRGDGKLVGDGSGSIDYSTGGTTINLDALPDVGSALVYSWGTKTHYTDAAGTGASLEIPTVEHQPGKYVDPGTLTIEWTDSNSNTRTLNDDGAGNLTGDGEGRVIYSGENRIIKFKPGTIPDSTTQYTITYDEPTKHTETNDTSNVLSSGSISLTLSNTPIRPGSVSITVPMRRLGNNGEQPHQAGGETTIDAVVQDDGNGNMLRNGQSIGTIDYSTGDVSFDAREDYEREVLLQDGAMKDSVTLTT